jgi:hypothetical protein
VFIQNYPQITIINAEMMQFGRPNLKPADVAAKLELKVESYSEEKMMADNSPYTTSRVFQGRMKKVPLIEPITQVSTAVHS